MKKILILTLLVVMSFANSEIEQYERAKIEAKEKGKYLIFYISGDWYPEFKLQKKLLESEKFLSRVNKKAVVITLDIKSNSQSLNYLANDFNIKVQTIRFPSFYIINKDNKFVTRISGNTRNALSYVDFFKQLKNKGLNW